MPRTKKARRWPGSIGNLGSIGNIGNLGLFGLTLLLACVAVESEPSWRFNGRWERGPVMQLAVPVEVGGAPVQFEFPEKLSRIVRLEADARDLPLGALLWVRMTDSGGPRNFLLAALFGHHAIVGTYRGAANWSESRVEVAPGERVSVLVQAIDWTHAQKLFDGGVHGEPIEGTGVSGFPYDRVVTLPDPLTTLRVMVEVLE